MALGSGGYQGLPPANGTPSFSRSWGGSIPFGQQARGLERGDCSERFACCDESNAAVSYVGMGQGAYRQDTTYNYVGEGAGEFQMVDLPKPFRWTAWTCCLALFAIFITLPVAVWFLWPNDADNGLLEALRPLSHHLSRSQATIPSPTVLSMTITGIDYDQLMGSVDLRDAFVQKMKEGIASEAGRSIRPDDVTIAVSAGSVVVKATIVPTAGAAVADLSTSKTLAHTVMKQVDAVPGIEHASTGRRSVRSVTVQDLASARLKDGNRFDCEAGLRKWETGWSEEKKDWCCTNKHKGCHPSSSAKYDCAIHGDPIVVQNWPLRQQGWCCAHYATGCSTSTSLETDPNCIDGTPDSWSLGKKVRCCLRHHKGCPETTAAPSDIEVPVPVPMPVPVPAPAESQPPDCDAGFRDWKRNWSDEKKLWCCGHGGHGCPNPGTTSLPYDCTEGAGEWKLGWSIGKKNWCCAHGASVGCTSRRPTTSMAYDCDAGFSKWETEWSQKKRQFCCVIVSRGCKTTSPPFDCNAGFSNWQRGWTDSKKSWCCAQVGRGCSGSFECNIGYLHWQTGWSESKKRWCCEHGGRGCPSSEPYDCNAGFANWGTGWSLAKKGWCCVKKARGCPTTKTSTSVSDLYNCDAGLKEDWQSGWSEGKKAWCCIYKKKACQ